MYLNSAFQTASASKARRCDYLYCLSILLALLADIANWMKNYRGFDRVVDNYRIALAFPN